MNIQNAVIDGHAGTLPAVGLSRWSQFKKFSPVSKEKYRQMANAGRAPRPIRLSQRCTVYKNIELHRFFADPANYRSEEQ